MVWPTFGSRTAKEQNRTYVTDLDESFNGLTVKSVNYSPYVTSYSSRCKSFYPRCGQGHSRSSAAMLFDKSHMISQWSCRVTIQYTSLKMELLWNSVAFALLCWLLLKQVYNYSRNDTTRPKPHYRRNASCFKKFFYLLTRYWRHRRFDRRRATWCRRPIWRDTAADADRFIRSRKKFYEIISGARADAVDLIERMDAITSSQRPRWSCFRVVAILTDAIRRRIPP